MGRAGRRPAAAFRGFQDPLDLGADAFAGAVEQGQAAVAVAQHAEHRRHPVDGALQHRRHLAVLGRQGGADVEQVGQRPGVTRRVALPMAAVGIDLGLDPVFQRRQQRRHPGPVAGEREAGDDRGADHRDGVGVRLRAERPAVEMPRLAVQGGGETVAEPGVGVRRERLEVDEPVDQAVAEDVEAPGRRRPGPVRVEPGGEPGPGLLGRGPGAPAEPMEGIGLAGPRGLGAGPEVRRRPLRRRVAAVQAQIIGAASKQRLAGRREGALNPVRRRSCNQARARGSAGPSRGSNCRRPAPRCRFP